MRFRVVDAEPSPVPQDLSRIDEEQLIALEFSEIGRSPRFIPGWFVLPVLMMIAVVAAGFLWELGR